MNNSEVFSARPLQLAEATIMSKVYVKSFPPFSEQIHLLLQVETLSGLPRPATFLDAVPLQTFGKCFVLHLFGQCCPATFSWLETPNNGPILIKIGQWLSKTANLANVEAALGLCFNILCSQSFLESWTFGKGHEEEGLTPAMQVRAKFSAFPPNSALYDQDKRCWRRARH